MNQQQYILKLLAWTSEAKTISDQTDPISKRRKIMVLASNDVDPNAYQSLVGSLLHANVETQPDIIQAVGVVSKFNSKPS